MSDFQFPDAATGEFPDSPGGGVSSSGGVATAYTVSGPSSGTTGQASTVFTLTPNGALSGADTVTLSDGGGGGMFTPSFLSFASGASAAQTFVYTPGSAGSKTLTPVSSTLGLPFTPTTVGYTSIASGETTLDIIGNPANAVFTALSTPPRLLAFAIPAGYVFDSVRLLRNATYTGYYTNIYNANPSYPALSFSGTAVAYLATAGGGVETGAVALPFAGGNLSGTGGTLTNDLAVLNTHDIPLLAYLNAHAGQTVYFYYQPVLATGTETLTSLDLQLTGTAAAVTPSYTFACAASPSDSNGFSTITVTLKDSGGNPVAAPSGGQIFMLGATGGTLMPTGLYIPRGASNGQAVLSNTVSGNVTVTITAGTGPCLGQSNCVVTVYLFTPPPATLDGGTPGLCLLKLTRANMRDNIRRRLGITPEIDIYPGASPGVQPHGEAWPTNPVLNQAIGDALRLIGRRTGWHSNTMLSINVPVATLAGPQWLPLQGVGAGPYQNLINRVKHIVFRDAGGNQAYRLQARSFEDLDRGRRLYDNAVGVSVPREFFIAGYQIALLPGASSGGTLQLYADTALIGFCSDDDTLDEVPIDYEPVIEEIATWYVRGMHPDDPEAGAQLQILPRQIEQSLKDVGRWIVTLNANQQYGMVPVVNRRRGR